MKRANNLLFTAVLLVFSVGTAWASDSSSDLEFVKWLQTIQEAISGPVASAIAVIAFCVCGFMLAFGTEISGVFKSLIITVMVVSFMIGANSIITTLGGSSAVIDELPEAARAVIAGGAE